MGFGNTGWVTLETYVDSKGKLYQVKYKKYDTAKFGDPEGDLKYANFLAQRLEGVSGVKSARHRKVRNPFSKYDNEIEYFEGDTVSNHLNKLKIKAELKETPEAAKDLENFENAYTEARKKIIQKILDDSKLRSLKLSISTYESPIPIPSQFPDKILGNFSQNRLLEIAKKHVPEQTQRNIKIEDFSKAELQKIIMENLPFNEIGSLAYENLIPQNIRDKLESASTDFSFSIERSALFSNEDYSYYLKPDNFVYTPEGDFVLIDPF